MRHPAPGAGDLAAAWGGKRPGGPAGQGAYHPAGGLCGGHSGPVPGQDPGPEHLTAAAGGMQRGHGRGAGQTGRAPGRAERHAGEPVPAGAVAAGPVWGHCGPSGYGGAAPGPEPTDCPADGGAGHPSAGSSAPAGDLERTAHLRQPEKAGAGGKAQPGGQAGPGEEQRPIVHGAGSVRAGAKVHGSGHGGGPDSGQAVGELPALPRGGPQSAGGAGVCRQGHTAHWRAETGHFCPGQHQPRCSGGVPAGL